MFVQSSILLFPVSFGGGMGGMQMNFGCPAMQQMSQGYPMGSQVKYQYRFVWFHLISEIKFSEYLT